MRSFYIMPQALCIALSMLSAICVIIQCVALVYNLNRYRMDRIQRLENALEAGILLQILIVSLLTAHAQNSMRDDLIVFSGYTIARPFFFFVLVILSGGVSWYRRTWKPMIPALVSVFTLPVLEILAGNAFSILYIFVILYFLLRSIYICIIRQKEFKTSLSALSIKEAIDALQSAILFCGQDGFILLMNRRMQILMNTLTGAIWRDGLKFSEEMEHGRCLKNCESTILGSRMVYRLPNQTVWMFSKHDMKIRDKKYYQISAADITQQWNATIQLQQQNDELNHLKTDLEKTINNLGTIYRKEETLRVKGRIHDTIGQRIAVLIRTLRENEKPDKNLLRTFTDRMFVDLAEEKATVSADQELNLLVKMFAGIGVILIFRGHLPKNKQLVDVFLKVITEGVTNAVRHGFSNEVNIVSCCRNNKWMLEIKNNGLVPDEIVVEGGGIKSMRRELSAIGGKLIVRTKPEFCLQAFINTTR